jgi:O-6-methylguanine DNA methyltransferase
MKFKFGGFSKMPDNGNEKQFFYLAEFSEFLFEIISNETSLLKIDFVKDKDKEDIINSEISDPINRALTFLDDYFSGRKNRIDLCLYKSGDVLFKKDSGKLYLDVSDYTEKEIGIYRSLIDVKPGKTVSYSDLSSMSGITGGARFAGNCMARNRFPIIIPCHRVIKRDGSMGNYSGGIWIKEFLLRHEQSFTWS